MVLLYFFLLCLLSYIPSFKVIINTSPKQSDVIYVLLRLVGTRSNCDLTLEGVFTNKEIKLISTLIQNKLLKS